MLRAINVDPGSRYCCSPEKTAPFFCEQRLFFLRDATLNYGIDHQFHYREVVEPIPLNRAINADECSFLNPLKRLRILLVNLRLRRE